MKGYPRGFFGLLLSSLLLLLLSGLLLTPTTLVMRLEWALPWQLPGGSRVGVGALHAAGAFLLLTFVGALWSVHMRAGWRKRQQRGSGAQLVVCLLLLALSALGVYYLGDESLAAQAALLHLASAAWLLPLLVWHGCHGHRARQRVRLAGRA